MRRFACVLLVAMAVSSASCSRKRAPGRGAGVGLARGDGVWLADGVPATGLDGESALARAPLTRVLLPSRRLTRASGTWKIVESQPPASPVDRLPVALVVEADEAFDAALSAGSIEPIAAAVSSAVGGAFSQRARFGRVEGIVLDLPFAMAHSGVYADVLGRVRARLPAGTRLTVAVRATPEEKDRDGFDRVLAASDGLVAIVFGVGPVASPIAVDALGRPWWAVYAPAARGSRRDTGGASQGGLPESVLRSMTDDARFTLGQDLVFRQENGSSFRLRVDRAAQAGGRTFAAGDEIEFRQPAISDLLYRLGSDAAGRRWMRGRIVRLDGSSDSERIFSLAALTDVLLGKSLVPDLRVTLEADRRGVRVSGENASGQASEISRTANWVEVDVPAAGIRDVEIGGFDRFEVFDPSGRPVSLGRATRVRFYEILVAPFEKIAAARIVLRRPPPAGCCPLRQHLLGAAGGEAIGNGPSGGSVTPAAGASTKRAS